MEKIDVKQLDEALEPLPIARDRDQFLRELIRELAGALEDIVGYEEAAGYISVVGGRIGDIMNREYRVQLKARRLTLPQVASALVDLKRRIRGDFHIESLEDGKIVLANRSCPFGDYVVGRPSLCMMTSNVFGRIAAENLGYAKVAVEQAIARGDKGCRIVLYLEPGKEGGDKAGREYFATSTGTL